MQSVEDLVERSLNHYQFDGLLAWTKTRGETTGGRFDAQDNWIYDAPPTPTYSITLMSGKHLWLEVIKATSKDRILDRKRVPQFREMMAHKGFGALAFILVFWAIEKEWRLYKVGKGGEGNAMEFIRSNGVLVEEDEEEMFPDWVQPPQSGD